jgi:cytochrome c biogenesis protein CcmG/thiol:disulfide interchange protein DsbE
VKRSAAPILAALAAAALVGLLVYGLVAKSDGGTLDDEVAKGMRPAAPDRPLPVLDGAGSRSLASYRGRVVVLNFWASWCDPCRIEAPRLERAHRRLGSRGTVLGVTFRDTTPDSLDFVKEFRLTYPNVRDVEGKLAKGYSTKALPETFVIDRRGRVVAISRGVVDDRFLERAIARAQRA